MNGNAFKHGHAKGHRGTREYYTWTGMKNRCLNPRNRAWKNYGGRGIKVCVRWLESYQNFRVDMGPKPPGATLERINNNGNYTPSNCRWATRKEQTGNTRRVRLITFQGVTKPCGWWADRYGIPRTTVITRLNLGWGITPALFVRRAQKENLR